MLFILIFIAFFFLFFFVSTIFFRPSSFSILLFFLLYLCYLLVSTFLICTTQSVQCEQRRIKHAQVFSTAQYNGWLAASQLGLRKCVKLAATGNTVSAIECAPINVTFTTEITSCGAQPRYKNFTVSRTGWELAAYKDCYWTSGTVYFNDRPHSY